MSNIQFNHDRKYKAWDHQKDEAVLNSRGGTTTVMEVPPSWLLEELKVGEFFTRPLGSARCSMDDNYNKKTGRELAKSRMKNTVFTVVSNEQYTNERMLCIRDDKGNHYLLKKPNKLDKVYFIGVDK